MLKGKKRSLLVLISLFVMLTSVIFAIDATVPELIKQADEFDNNKNFFAAMKMLRQAESIDKDNPEVLWRIAREYFQFADQNPTDKGLQKKNLYPGFEYAKKCVEIAPNIAGGHQYYAILIGRIGEEEGTKQKIKNSYPLKEHTLKAIALDPENDSNYHVMGRWHFALSELSWVERKVANIIYSTVPNASFEEAAQYFSKANELKPGEIRHMLYLGKTYIKLGKNSQAKKILQSAEKISPKSDSEKGMLSEVKELLKDLK